MHQRKLNLDEIKNAILSPGEIFWIKNSGAKVLLCKKGDVCNLSLIQKLINNHQELIIENEIDKNFIYEANELINKYSEQVHAKDKDEYRNIIFKFLVDNFVNSEKTLFEFNFITWKWFSTIQDEKAVELIDYDREWFIRTMGVSGLATIVAWSMGYCDLNYLKQKYAEVFMSAFDFIKNENPIQGKEKIAEFFNTSEDYPIQIAGSSKSTLFEKQNGTGPLKYKGSELSDYELTLALINKSIRVFEVESEINFLKLLVIGDVELSPRVKNDILRKFDFKTTG